MDISGAFDTVNHTRLLDNLCKKRVPSWFVRTIRSFLSSRTTTLVIDGQETQPRSLLSGVPQGSPLSPILFLFYNTPLLEALQQAHPCVSVLGFADDVNLLSYGDSTEATCSQLEEVHQQAEEYARTHGMKFAPGKYALTHFSRTKQFNMQKAVKLEGIIVEPVEALRILGLHLDSRLNWKTQEKKIHEKMQSQLLALSRTTASTWGATMVKARQLYLAIIRSSLTYGATAWHTPATATTNSWTGKGKAKGLAIKLQKHQNTALRTVLGAFKATPVRQLETESFTPPLDLWLNGKLAGFQSRLNRTKIGEQIQEACILIQTRLRIRGNRRRGREAPNLELKDQLRTKWANEWSRTDISTQYSFKKEVLRDWKARWQAGNQRIGRPWGRGLIRTDTEPNKKVLQLHKGLRKAESSLLTQVRTEKIGLAKFLYERHVSGIDSRGCSCGFGYETPRHIALHCEKESIRREQLRQVAGLNYDRLVGSCEGAKHFVRWLMLSRRLGQFSLARDLLYVQKV